MEAGLTSNMIKYSCSKRERKIYGITDVLEYLCGWEEYERCSYFFNRVDKVNNLTVEATNRSLEDVGLIPILLP